MFSVGMSGSREHSPAPCDIFQVPETQSYCITFCLVMQFNATNATCGRDRGEARQAQRSWT
ncbi:hypothetical protein PILCRDRAFT_817967 [Piloderma croceum F 1598]|uniref:Uncharacterized protein n=1 Tax=Piloderma croceum (strain F 1598) TaxID=765440 RepID=A0A0C3FZF1_PILCF|nr:hypothetical protein PILCRDRAFT_817967 [Piloderma croceum F 1598]